MCGQRKRKDFNIQCVNKVIMWYFKSVCALFFVCLINVSDGQSVDNRYALNILHYNDFHAR